MLIESKDVKIIYSSIAERQPQVHSASGVVLFQNVLFKLFIAAY